MLLVQLLEQGHKERKVLKVLVDHKEHKVLKVIQVSLEQLRVHKVLQVRLQI